MNHIVEQSLNTEVFILDWLYTLFARAFDIKIVRVVWDCYFIFGEFYIIKAALALFIVLKKYMMSDELVDGF
jgi:hypothetical protein